MLRAMIIQQLAPPPWPHFQAADAAPKAVHKAAPKAAVAPTAQCKRLARDCVVHALFRAGETQGKSCYPLVNIQKAIENDHL